MTNTNHRFSWLGLALISATLSATSVVAQVSVTLPDAIELALQTSPTLIQARGDIRSAEAARREYVGEWLPSLTSSGSASTNSSSRFDQATQRTVTGSSTSYSTSLSASYNIFDGFRRSANGRTSSANLESAHASLTNQRFQIVLQTKQAFFNALAADELVRVSQTRIQRAERQLQDTRDRLSAGSAIRSDTLGSFVELSNARLQLLNAQTQYATATASLARLIGIDEAVVVVADSSLFDLIELDTAAIRQEALANSPSLLQTTSQARAADAAVGASRAQYFPSVSGSYSRSWSGAELTGLQPAWTARLSLSFPIFNGFTREAGVVRARVQQEAARARVDDSRRQVNADLTQQFAALQSALVRFQIAQASRVAAAEDLRVQQERYGLGMSTIFEVLTTQVNLDQTDVDLVQARFDYQVARAQIEALIGREIE